MTKASAADVAKNFGRYQDEALHEPVFVQKYNRDSVVIISAREYERLRKLDRRAVAVEELNEPEFSALRATAMASEHAALNALLEA